MLYIQMKKHINFWIDKNLLDKIDEQVKKSNNVYKDRTQFIILAIQEGLK